MKGLIQKILIFWLLFTIAIAIACATQPESRSLADKTQELINQKKYRQAYEMLKPLADTGNPEANNEIADIYSHKDKENPYYNLEKAKQSLYIAANAGIAWGQIGLAQVLRHQFSEIYLKDIRNLNKPEIKALWEKNTKESCMWYEKAARQGIGLAMLSTGHCYHRGEITGRPDYITAYAWYALAEGRFEVEEGDPTAPQSMAEEFMRRTAKRGNLTKEQIQQALNLAKKLRDKISKVKKE